MPAEHDASLDRGEAYQEFFGDLHYTFDHNGAHFIVLDNVSDPTGTKGLTPLFDAVYLGLEQMKSANNKRKALLLINDGEDNHSRYSFFDVKEFSSRAGCSDFCDRHCRFN